ncbi:MAG: hypothetical protein ABI885_30410 [Gammaproteobacteria bacterium]
MKKPTRKEVRVLCDESIAEIHAILRAPVVDLDAPAGFVGAAFAVAETERRSLATTAALGRLTYRIKCRYGEQVALAARQHVEPLIERLQRRE